MPVYWESLMSMIRTQGRNRTWTVFPGDLRANSVDSLRDFERDQVFLRGLRVQPTRNARRAPAEHQLNDQVTGQLQLP